MSSLDNLLANLQHGNQGGLPPMPPLGDGGLLPMPSGTEGSLGGLPPIPSMPLIPTQMNGLPPLPGNLPPLPGIPPQSYPENSSINNSQQPQFDTPPPPPSLGGGFGITDSMTALPPLPQEFSPEPIEITPAKNDTPILQPMELPMFSMEGNTKIYSSSGSNGFSSASDESDSEKRFTERTFDSVAAAPLFSQNINFNSTLIAPQSVTKYSSFSFDSIGGQSDLTDLPPLPSIGGKLDLFPPSLFLEDNNSSSPLAQGVPHLDQPHETSTIPPVIIPPPDSNGPLMGTIPEFNPSPITNLQPTNPQPLQPVEPVKEELPSSPIVAQNTTPGPIALAGIPTPLSMDLLSAGPMKPGPLGVGPTMGVGPGALLGVGPTMGVGPAGSISVGPAGNILKQSSGVFESNILTPDPVFDLPSVIPQNKQSSILYIAPPPPTQIFGLTGPVVRANILSDAVGTTCAVPGELRELTSEPPPFFHPMIGRRMALPEADVRNEGEVRYVSATDDIQKAVDSAPTGSIIEFAAGKYKGTVLVRKPLTLRAAGEVIIEATGDGGAIIVSARGVIIEGLKLVANSSSLASSANSAIAVFRQCQFFGRSRQSFGVRGQSYILFADSQFVGGSIGVDIDDSSKARFFRCVFGRQSSVCLYTRSTAHVVVDTCDLSTSDDMGVVISGGSSCSLLKSKLHDFGKACVQVTSTSIDVYIGECEINGCGHTAIHLAKAAKVTLVQNVIQNARKGVIMISQGARAILFENTITAAPDSDAIVTVMSRGRCYMNGDRMSGGCMAAIKCADGSLYSARSSSFQDIPGVGIFASGASIRATKCTFSGIAKKSIQASQKTSVKLLMCSFKGSDIGVHINPGCSGSIRYCTFEANKNIALVLNGDIGAFEVSNTEFCNGNSLGVFIKDNSEPIFTDCVFRGCKESGIELEESKPAFQFCEFVDNNNIGIDIDRRSDLAFSGCVFRRNKYGIRAMGFSNIAVTNCLLVENNIGLLATTACNVKVKVSRITGNAENVVANGNDVELLVKKTVIADSTEGPGLKVISGARVELHSVEIHHNGAVGVQLESRGSLMADGTTIYENGAGMAIFSTAGALALKGCKIHDEEQSAIVARESSAVELLDVDVSDVGGAGFLAEDAATRFDIRNCVFLRCNRAKKMVAVIIVKDASGKITSTRIATSDFYGVYTSSLAEVTTDQVTFTNMGIGNIKNE